MSHRCPLRPHKLAFIGNRPVARRPGSACVCSAASAPPQQQSPGRSNGASSAAGTPAAGFAESPAPAAMAPMQVEASQQGIMATFRWPAGLGGSEVSLIGSFNGWSQPLPLTRAPLTGDFVRSMLLPPGLYQYKYLVDGRWTTSPVERVTADAKGRWNNLCLIAHNLDLRLEGLQGGRAAEVMVAGSFNAWAELVPAELEAASGDYVVPCSLAPGPYNYQFLVEGNWRTAPGARIGTDEQGHVCNQVVAPAARAFQVYYATGWAAPQLHFRICSGQPEAATQGWQVTPMFETSSRAAPSGGRWRHGMVPLPRRAAGHSVQDSDPTLEFWVEGDDGKVDAPQAGECYSLPGPGAFKLQHGQLKPFPQATAAPTMLVSDLDGTMVGEGLEADTATAAFTRYWEAGPALRGSALVYNTGRSLGQFVSLLQEKAGALAVPDVLITAVGTKIFLLDTEGGGRGGCSGLAWREDEAWSRILDEGWDLGRIKVVADRIIAEQAADDAAHWLDRGTEHPHRIALSVRADRVQGCLQQLQDGAAEQGLRVHLIVSGVGEWRYLDCVSIRAGKQEALEYVRGLYGVPLERCMAAGDSGNDTLMLAGKHRAIVVGNAQPALLQWLLEQSQSPRTVYTDASIASGVLEGIARHGLY